MVWGTGSEFNATVEPRTINRQPHHEIVIIDQGKEFEPNATMGMLHWPIEPFTMWTFDRHETLYDNDSNARYKPSLPGINRFDLQILFIIGALMKRMELSLLTDQPVETVPLILTLQIGMQRLIYLISIPINLGCKAGHSD